VRTLRWQPELDPRARLESLVGAACEPGLLVVVFPRCPRGPELPWRDLEAWVRGRAVTVADVEGDLEAPAASVALCADLVFLRRGVRVDLGDPAEPPPPGVLWALGRAGGEALARGVLEGGWLAASEAVHLGLARAELEPSEPLPLPSPHSRPALTAARDLLRCRAVGSSAMALELATFRLLVATGHPKEGALAFLKGREPEFR
jgi:hypothetical protein